MNLVDKAGAVHVYTDNGRVRSSNFNEFKLPSFADQIENGPASIKIGFRNCTNSSVIVRDRHNIPLVIPVDDYHKQTTHERGFFIYKVYTVQAHTVGSILVAVRNVISSLGKGISAEELFSLRRLLENNRCNSNFQRVIIEHVYTFQERDYEIEDIYDSRTDLVISKKAAQDVAVHPMSPHFVDQNCLSQQALNRDIHTAGTALRYVNRNNSNQCKFVNLLGVVHKLCAISDAPAMVRTIKDTKGEREVTLDEYIEVYESTTTAIDPVPLRTGIVKTILTLEEAMLRFGVYDCSGDAKVYGSPDKMLERDASEAKYQLTKLQERIAREKLERDAKERDQQADFDRFRREQNEDFDRRKRDDEYLHQQSMNNMKADYERASNSRKDWSEWFKFITGLILTIGTIALAIIKMRPPVPAS